MASITTRPDGCRMVQFTDAARRRRSVYLGAVPMKVAEAVKAKVEHVNALNVAGLPLDADAARWLAGIGDDLHAKLAAVGLIPEREARVPAVSVAGLLDLYLAEKERDNKPGTKTNHRTLANDLTGYFGDRPAAAVTPAAAAGFLESLRTRGLAAATVARRVRRARSVFAFAEKKKLVPANPFAEVRAATVLPADRKAYLPAADAAKLIAAAPNATWRGVIALARFGGLRCPSEVLTLPRAGVDLAAGRMVVDSPKTGKRACPIFAALRPYVEEQLSAGGKGEPFVLAGKLADYYRATAQGKNGWVNTNLRTPFMKLVRRCGMAPWPRIFHTLRASCETDLLEQGLPLSAVAEWLGHSPAIALKHYTRVPDHLFERAAGGAGAEKLLHELLQSGTAASDRETSEPPATLSFEGFRRLVTGADGHCQQPNVTLRGFDSPAATDEADSTLRFQPIAPTAQTTAPPDPHLARVLAAWPDCGPADRARLAGAAEACAARRRAAA